MADAIIRTKVEIETDIKGTEKSIDALKASFKASEEVVHKATQKLTKFKEELKELKGLQSAGVKQLGGVDISEKISRRQGTITRQENVMFSETKKQAEITAQIKEYTSKVKDLNKEVISLEKTEKSREKELNKTIERTQLAIERNSQMTNSILRLTAMMQMFNAWNKRIQNTVVGSTKTFSDFTIEADKSAKAVGRVTDNVERLAKARQVSVQFETLRMNVDAVKVAFGELISGPLSMAMRTLNQFAIIMTNVISSMPAGMGFFITFGSILITVILAAFSLWVSIKRIVVLLDELAKAWGFAGDKAWVSLKKTQFAVNLVATSLLSLTSAIMFVFTLFSLFTEKDPMSGLREQIQKAKDDSDKLKRSLMGFDQLNILQKEQETGIDFDGMFSNMEDMNNGLKEMQIVLVVIQGLLFAISAMKFIGLISELGGIAALFLKLQGIVVAFATKAMTGLVSIVIKLQAAMGAVAFTIGVWVAALAAVVAAVYFFVKSLKDMKTGTAIVLAAVAALVAVLTTWALLKFTPFGWATAVPLGLAAGAAALAGGTAIARNVPALAQGGVTTGPTFALIGEKAGSPHEAVIPLGNSPQFKSMKDDIADAVAQRDGINGGEISIRNIIELDGRVLKEFIEKTVNNYIQPQIGRTIRDLGRSV